jgi:hypothetical protein
MKIQKDELVQPIYFAQNLDGIHELGLPRMLEPILPSSGDDQDLVGVVLQP